MLLNKVHNSDEIDNINRPASIKEIEFSVKNLSRGKLQAQMASLMKSFKYSKRNTYHTQTLPENWRRGNTSQFVPWGYSKQVIKIVALKI